MANIFDPINEEDERPEGYNPTSSSRSVPAQISSGGKVFWIIIIILTLGLALIAHISWANYFRRQENTINEASSTIDTQLAKRFNTMSTLVEAAKSYLKHEKGIFEEVAKFRSMTNSVRAGSASPIEKAELNSGLSGFMSKFMAVYENYPQLKANESVNKLMEEAAYLEAEIAASRRLYNSAANEFNQEIMTWPKSFKAYKMQLKTYILFKAAPEERKRVSASLN